MLINKLDTQKPQILMRPCFHINTINKLLARTYGRFSTFKELPNGKLLFKETHC